MAELADFLGGLATGIGDFGKGVFDLLGTGAAAFKDLGRGISTGKFDTSEQDAFKKWLYGTDNRKDAYNKSSGTMLNGASTVADFVPGLNTLTSGPIGNAAQGAIGGFADELKTNGANFDWGSAGLRATSGAAAGAATGLLGNGINKSLSKATQTGTKNFLTKAGSNAISRGALTGALGGATAGAVSTGLNGGSLEEILGNAVSSGASGALQGGVTGGAMNTVSKTLAKTRDAGWRTLQDSNFKKAISNPDTIKNPVYLGELQDGAADRLNAAFDEVDSNRAAMGLDPIDRTGAYVENNSLYLTKDGAQHIHNARMVNDGMTAKAVTKTMRNATGAGSTVVPNYKYPRNATIAKMGDNNMIDVAHVTGRDGNVSLETTYPSRKGKNYEQLKSTLVGAEATSTADNDGLPARLSALQSANSSISQNANDVNTEFNPYGKSQLANRTKAGLVKDGLNRLGNTLEGAQTNVTRAAARDLGIESVGKSVENVRRKTGLTNLETQAQFASELTGKADSLLDNIQRNALAASEDGKPFKVDTTGIAEDVKSIVDKHIGRDTLGSENAKQKFIKNLRADITDGSSDVLSLANRFKSEAANYRGKGIIDASPQDKAKAKVYTEIAQKLDDASYSAIPQENVNTMFEVAIDNMKQRAQDARNNGNNTIAKAYDKAADVLDNEPRTIRAYRSFKKDFVDIAKIDKLSAQAETGAAFQMGSSFAGGAKRFTNALLQRPANAALAKAGGAINSIADSSAINGIGAALSGIGSIEKPGSDFNTALYNIAGRNIGRGETYGVSEEERAQLPAFPVGGGVNMEYGTGDFEAMGRAGNQTAADTSTNPYAKQVDIIGNALQYALEAGDAAAYVQLLSMYNDAYQNYASVEKENNKSSELSSTQQKTILGIQNAYSSLQQLEQMYNEAGGGQGLIGGNLANFLSGIGANDAVAAYNQQSQSLINTIKDAVGKTDTANTEGEVARLMELIPKITDTNGVAQKKINNLYNELEKIYQNTLNNYSGNYALI